MAVKDLQARQGNVDLVLEIVEKGNVREFEKFGKAGKVCNCKAKDDTGTITLALWNDDVDKVSVGDKVHVQNGWVSEWQGELQLSTGKFGKLEIVGKDPDETVDEATEAEIASPSGSDEGEHILTEDEKAEEEILEELDEPDSDESEVTEDEKIEQESVE